LGGGYPCKFTTQRILWVINIQKQKLILKVKFEKRLEFLKYYVQGKQACEKMITRSQEEI